MNRIMLVWINEVHDISNDSRCKQLQVEELCFTRSSFIDEPIYRATIWQCMTLVSAVLHRCIVLVYVQ